MVSRKDKLSGQDLGPRKDNDFLVEYKPMGAQEKQPTVFSGTKTAASTFIFNFLIDELAGA